MTPINHQSRRDYFAANAPAEIPPWFKFDYPLRPKLPNPASLSEEHRNQWDGLCEGLEDDQVDPEVIDFRELYDANVKAIDQYDIDFATARFTAWRWHYADLMIAASTSSAKTPLLDYAHTAMCIWEWLIPHSERDTEANAIKKAIGTVELRYAAATLVPFCNQVYAGLPADITNFNTFDWDLIPAILETVTWQKSGPITPDIAEAITAVVQAFTPQEPADP